MPHIWPIENKIVNAGGHDVVVEFKYETNKPCEWHIRDSTRRDVSLDLVVCDMREGKGVITFKGMYCYVCIYHLRGSEEEGNEQ